MKMAIIKAKLKAELNLYCQCLILVKLRSRFLTSVDWI